MIGTHPQVRALIVLALISALAIPFILGCNDLPVSAPGTNSGTGMPSHYAVPAPDGRKFDVAETTGVVADIDYTELRLRVGHLWFQADAETEIETDVCNECVFADVHAGDAVKVKHERTPNADGSYTALEIEVENEDGDDVEDPEDDEAATEGTVSAVDASAFQVDGAWFWTDAATEFEVDECAAGPVTAGDYVKVEHSTVDTAGFGYYAFKVELKRECEEEEGEEDGAAIAVE